MIWTISERLNRLITRCPELKPKNQSMSVDVTEYIKVTEYIITGTLLDSLEINASLGRTSKGWTVYHRHGNVSTNTPSQPSRLLALMYYHETRLEMIPIELADMLNLDIPDTHEIGRLGA